MTEDDKRAVADMMTEDREEIRRLRAVNAQLLAACELWDKGFVEGEEFTPEQFLAWVNRNRAAARAAIAKAKEPRP